MYPKRTNNRNIHAALPHLTQISRISISTLRRLCMHATQRIAIVTIYVRENIKLRKEKKKKKRDRDKDFLNPGPSCFLNHLMNIFETFYILRSVASSREVKEK